MAEDRSTGLLTGLDLESLKRRIKRAPLQGAYQRMVGRWREALECIARGEEPDHPASLGWRMVTPFALEAAFIWRMTGDAEALSYVENRIAKLAEVTDDPETGWVPALSHAQMALATDMCRDGLSEGAYHTICDLARERFIDFHAAEVVNLRYGAGRNTPVCQTVCAGIAALVLGEECGHTGWETVVGFGRDAAVQYLRRGVDANGYPFEGSGYGHETFYYVYLMAELLRQNGRDNLFETEPNLRNIPLASLSVLFPDRSHLVNVNDIGLMFPHSMPYLLLTARHYGRAVDAGFWDEFQGFQHPQWPCGDVVPWFKETYGRVTRGWDHIPSLLLAILWWRPETAHTSIETAGLPTANYAPGIEMANFRTSWSHDAT